MARARLYTKTNHLNTCKLFVRISMYQRCNTAVLDLKVIIIVMIIIVIVIVCG